MKKTRDKAEEKSDCRVAFGDEERLRSSFGAQPLHSLCGDGDRPLAIGRSPTDYSSPVKGTPRPARLISTFRRAPNSHFQLQKTCIHVLSFQQVPQVHIRISYTYSRRDQLPCAPCIRFTEPPSRSPSYSLLPPLHAHFLRDQRENLS